MPASSRPDPASHPFDRLHGRRRGRPLREGQRRHLEEVLPAFSTSSAELERRGPAALFDRAPKSIWLEAGFGAGEHLAAQAAAHPDIGLIGCEVFQTGLAKLAGRLAEGAIRNVRIIAEDVRNVLRALPDASIGRAFILFPDPWPKQRHHKRRLVSRATMDELARVLSDSAELRLATDDVAYLRVMLAVACGHEAFEWLARHPADWRVRPDDWPATRYEMKALRQGRTPAFLALRRVPRADTVGCASVPGLD